MVGIIGGPDNQGNAKQSTESALVVIFDRERPRGRINFTSSHILICLVIGRVTDFGG
ncbi:hypothetical protein POX_f07995 [Penicillium oxalicum]|uniref:hypothetical protein n=1 Tax=Penicillium oxalicum TaxID=69781 RepID=UPI0020B6BADB|nr:hypothetical protein POX_f07995 [Penicillium oxalicum]KAI2787622.1 hypothetical protein POX_f07995 [Penicillium oxalicum]